MPEFRLKKSTTMIGRDPQCDIVVPDTLTRVSRRHAEIRREGAYLVLYDQSTHGTLVNGEKIERGERKPLRDGDLVSLGGQADFTYQGGSLHGAGKSGPIKAKKRKTTPPPPPPPPQTNYMPVLFAIGALLVIAVAAWFWMNSRPTTSNNQSVICSNNDPLECARDVSTEWVFGKTSLIAKQITDSTIGQIPLEEPILNDKITEQIRQKSAWTFNEPEKVTEDTYHVNVSAQINLRVIDQGTYNIAAIYRLTIDTKGKAVREYDFAGARVTR